MTTPKRCEVCGKEKCHGCGKGHAYCHIECIKATHDGSSSPPPRPDEWEKEFDEEFGKFVVDVIDGDHGRREYYLKDEDCFPVIKSFIRSLLLSYGKEREKEIFRKCREAVEKAKEEALKLPMGADGGWNQVSHGLLKSLSALDSVNPER